MCRQVKIISVDKKSFEVHSRGVGWAEWGVSCFSQGCQKVPQEASVELTSEGWGVGALRRSGGSILHGKQNRNCKVTIQDSLCMSEGWRKTSLAERGELRRSESNRRYVRERGSRSGTGSVAQLCLDTFSTPWTVACQGPLWDFPGKNTGVGCRFLLC